MMPGWCGPRFPSHLRRAAAPQHLPRRSELDVLRAARKAEARGQSTGVRRLGSTGTTSCNAPPTLGREARHDTTEALGHCVPRCGIAGRRGPARSAEPHWPDALVLATASPGGTYHAYGEGLARILARVLGDCSLNAAPRRAGPSENVRLIEAGQAQIGFVTMGAALQAWSGAGDWTAAGGSAPSGAVPDVRHALPLHRPAGYGHQLVAGLAGERSASAPAARPRATSPAGCQAGVEVHDRSTAPGPTCRAAPGRWSWTGCPVAAGVPFPAITELEARRAVRYLPLSRDQITSPRLAAPELTAC